MHFMTQSAVRCYVNWWWSQPAQAMPGTSPMLAIGPALAEAAAEGMARVNTWLLKIVLVQHCYHPTSCPHPTYWPHPTSCPHPTYCPNPISGDFVHDMHLVRRESLIARPWRLHSSSLSGRVVLVTLKPAESLSNSEEVSWFKKKP